ncbi:phosphatidate cytidylyltransferase, mitochondrial [Culicoides brevitarsis]|uniref:phosphatidate cytidylyltransferase, mitochondrial n=1 Tax=Culicoides brevitarsis TaxID=469753 RepID=UPI00307CAA63
MRLLRNLLTSVPASDAKVLTKGNISPIYYRILSKFPLPLSFCFGYGSGVKEQLGYDKATKRKNMIDLIYCVDNAHRWHAANLERNPEHYSALATFGSDFIASYQRSNFGARVYFNTLVPIEEENIMIKYGVVATDDLIEDLLDWRDLYIAGRLHKPVEIVKPPTNVKLENGINNNLKSAVHAALLLLPETFTEYEFYFCIASLSYMGDFRMTFGENKDKVKNIVRPQLESFQSLYAPTLKILSEYVRFPSIDGLEVNCKQDCSGKAIMHHLNSLPKWPLRNIVKEWNRGKYKQDTEDVLRAVAHSPEYQSVVRRSLNAIVFQSSAKQSLKNVPTAGLGKSLKYSWAKIQKMLQTKSSQ